MENKYYSFLVFQQHPHSKDLMVSILLLKSVFLISLQTYKELSVLGNNNSCIHAIILINQITEFDQKILLNLSTRSSICLARPLFQITIPVPTTVPPFDWHIFFIFPIARVPPVHLKGAPLVTKHAIFLS
jgi:hypothetical protein